VVRRAVGNLRGVLSELYPVQLDDLGLEAAVQELAQPLRAAGIRVDVQMPGDVELDRTTSVLIYRVAREALRNVEKHAGAGLVTVALRVAGDEAVLTVTDDGRGFDPDAAGPRGHLGLHLVRDTVTEVGGQVVITSAPGVGTRLEMCVPVR
jgi:two-component system, NarL family, sensor kinase